MTDKKAWAAKHISDEVVMRSSSGGAFTALSDEILHRGGVIIGASYDYKKQALTHKIARNYEERNAMRGSKYIWSELGNVYQESLEEIQQGKWVLFVGTPCQCAGYRNFLTVKNIPVERVVICDIVCHGTPIKSLWSDYVAYLNKKYKSAIERVNFRDKRNGWSRPTTVANIEGQEISIADYIDLYYSKCALQSQCYSCKFANLDRPSDITIGDYWGIEKSLPSFCDKKGVSLIITHTDTGEHLLSEAKKDLNLVETPIEAAMQPNLCCPTAPAPEREKFLAEYKKWGIGFVLHKYSRSYLFGKVRNKIKYLINR